MLIPRLNRGAPDRLFISCYNDSGSALAKAQVVCFSMDGTRDGYEVADPTVALTFLTAGLAHAATPSGDYGLVQIYGLDDDAVITRHGIASQSNGAIGDAMILYTASSALTCITAGGSTPAVVQPWFVLAQTQASTDTSGLTTTGKVFIRAM